MDGPAARRRIIATIKPQSGGIEMDSDLVAIDADEALVQRFQRGDATAFDTLYLKYEQRIYFQILSIVGDPQDAEDIKMEVFWKVHQQLFTVCLERSFKAWILTIAKHSSIDYLRRRQSKEPPTSLGDDQFIYDQGPSPEEKVIADELLREALQRLKPRLREILDLDTQGYSPEEIARILGLKASSVRTHFTQARREMRQFFHDATRRRKHSGRKILRSLILKKKPGMGNDQQYSE